MKIKLTPEERKFVDRWNFCVNYVLENDPVLKQQTQVAEAMKVFPDRLNVWRNYGSIPTAQNIIAAVQKLHFNPLFLYHNIGSPLAHIKDFQRDFGNMAKLKSLEQTHRMIKDLVSLNGK